MALVRTTLALTMALGTGLLAGQARPPAAAPPAQPPAVTSGQPQAQTPAPRRNRRRGAAVMTMTSTAWTDGAAIPAKYTQAGPEMSPPLAWREAPEGVVSYVLVARDMDAAVGDGTGQVLHWLVWNIPATSTGLPEHVPAVAELEDGTRQISQTGPYYRGPGAMAAGPAHHYVFELFALDATVDVEAVGQSPADTYAAVLEAMRSHVLGKAAYMGTFKRAGE